MTPLASLCVAFVLAALPAPLPVAAQAPAQDCPASDQVQLEKLKVLRMRFGFNESTLTPEARDTLAEVGTWLKTQPKLNTTITGHADERGTVEYNLALGERRALAITTYLESLGVPAKNLRAVSYGEEKPASGVTSQDAEEVWSANRRVEFVPTGEVVNTNQACLDAASAKAAADKEAADRKAKEDAERAAREQAEKDRLAKEEAARRAAAAKGQGNGEGDGWAAHRRFPWIPWWLGPVIMVASAPPLLLASPFLASIFYMGPSVIQTPAVSVEPVLVGSNAVNSNPLTWPGSLWSVLLHPDQQNYAIPALAVGIAGTALFAGVAVVTFAVGLVFTILYFIPGGSEQVDAAAADAASKK